ncbi:hypothetical protein TNCV_2555891 [Trichonephila clavipes]|nr:hypothetical protein TNCV_2555891 [Trichonephila clavipes]
MINEKINVIVVKEWRVWLELHFYTNSAFRNRTDDVQELPDSPNQELTMDELIKMHEQEQDIEERESLDPIQSEDRITVGNLSEGFWLN